MSEVLSAQSGKEQQDENINTKKPILYGNVGFALCAVGATGTGVVYG